ncbi:MAG: bi-domain-containing oxidoreductase [Thermodesulfobacteriota bacterium]
MKQIIQNYKTGELQLVEVPSPALKPESILVRNFCSLLSIGTEKYMVELAQKSLLGKALARPDLVKKVINKVRAEGLIEAYRQAMGRLDTPVALGYSGAGIVIDCGFRISDCGLKVGDRVACAGSGYASHAEILSVPQTLASRIPVNVTFEEASFVALGAIAIHAVRMANLTFGERVVVLGLGLLGQIAIQVLNATGCYVLGLDPNRERCLLAEQYGARATASDPPNLLSIVQEITDGKGVDAVIIFASTESNEPIELAAEIARDRARIVVPGLVGLNIPRKLFYEKELNFVVSRAWGPGMYDPDYESGKVDYPSSYVRWTAQRNMAQFLEMLNEGKVKVAHLITHRFSIEKAHDAYELVLKHKEPYIGILITYPSEKEIQIDKKINLTRREKPNKQDTQERLSRQDRQVRVGLIGAGLFARGTLLPVLKKFDGLSFRAVATLTGLSSNYIGKRYGFDYCSTDPYEILNDPEIDLVMILTRHGSHAHWVCEALKAGKNVFVEKPLCLNKEQLNQIISTYSSLFTHHSSLPLLMVGFNRRFSPFARWLKERFAGTPEPLAVHCTVNAGPVPPDHWVHDPEQGGGRIIGEVCHFVDLIQYLTGSVPVRVYAETLESAGYKPSDNVVITLKMANGAIGSITYLAGGDKRYPRERVEVFGGGAVGVIENFKAATFTRGGRRKSIRNWLSVDRGHRGEVEGLLSAIRDGGPAPVAFEEYVYTTLATFAIEESLQKGVPVSLTRDISDPIEEGER